MDGPCCGLRHTVTQVSWAIPLPRAQVANWHLPVTRGLPVPLYGPTLRAPKATRSSCYEAALLTLPLFITGPLPILNLHCNRTADRSISTCPTSKASRSSSATRLPLRSRRLLPPPRRLPRRVMRMLPPLPRKCPSRSLSAPRAFVVLPLPAPSLLSAPLAPRDCPPV